jgi:hypothetical protein
MKHDDALGVVRLLINNGLNREDAINNRLFRQNSDRV